MDQNKRPFIFAGILVAVLAAGQGRSWYLQPLRDAERDRVSAQNDLNDAEAEELLLMTARSRIEDARAASLPPSENDAQRLYLEWITNLAQENNFARAQVTPARKERRGENFQLVSVRIEAESSLENLSRFLFQFRQADLMHRIRNLVVNSTGTSGKPRMEFSLTAEAMSVTGAEDRLEMAARSPLRKTLDADAVTLQVADAAGFPDQVPFLIKLDNETLQVTGLTNDGWTVERAHGGGSATLHEGGAVVRHFPVMPRRRDRRFDEFQDFIGNSLFVKPPEEREYQPELTGIENVTIAPGETAFITARVDDYNADVGDVTFALKTEIDGLKIDTKTGQLKWETLDDQEPREYQITILATQQNNPELELQQGATITVKLLNAAPEIELPATTVIWLGRAFKLAAKATDDGHEDQLTWTLETEEPPEGLELNSKTGELSWTPPMTFAPGTHTITVKVSDQGDPPESAAAEIQLEVKDDDAHYTRLAGELTKDGRAEAWFQNSRTNKDLTVYVGDRLQVADIDAEVVEIQPRVVTLKDAEGTWHLALGDSLRQRVRAQPSGQ